MQFSKRWGSFAIAIALSAVLVWLLLRQIENKSIVSILRAVSPSLALFAFALYLLIYRSRALRFNSLLTKPISLSKMFTIMGMHNIVNLLMPPRSGELTYPYLLKKQGIAYAESLSGLIAARLFDLLSIFILFVVMVPFVGPLPAFTQKILSGFLAMIVIVFVAIGTLLLHKQVIKRWVDRFRKFCRVSHIAWMNKLQRLAGNTVHALKKYATRHVLGKLLIHSTVQWALMFFFSYIVLRALGMAVTLPQSFIGSSLSMLVLVIPFHGVLGFG